MSMLDIADIKIDVDAHLWFWKAKVYLKEISNQHWEAWRHPKKVLGPTLSKNSHSPD